MQQAGRPIRVQATDGEEFWAFSNPEFVFNNFYPASFWASMHQFNCSQQHYEWTKANYLADFDKAAQILECQTPMELTTLRPTINHTETDWGNVKRHAMFLSNLDKFRQNDELAHILLATGNMPIVNAIPGDEFWSIGVHIHGEELKDKNQWTGQNAMGDVLRMVRNELQFFMMDFGWNPPPFCTMRF